MLMFSSTTNHPSYYHKQIQQIQTLSHTSDPSQYEDLLSSANITVGVMFFVLGAIH